MFFSFQFVLFQIDFTGFTYTVLIAIHLNILLESQIECDYLTFIIELFPREYEKYKAFQYRRPMLTCEQKTKCTNKS